MERTCQRTSGDVVLGVERDRRLALLRLHRRDALEVGVGQQLGAEPAELLRERLGPWDFDEADNEELRAALLADRHTPPTIEQRAVASFIDKVVAD
jgi:hypothetical protein